MNGDALNTGVLDNFACEVQERFRGKQEEVKVQRHPANELQDV